MERTIREQKYADMDGFLADYNEAMVHLEIGNLGLLPLWGFWRREVILMIMGIIKTYGAELANSGLSSLNYHNYLTPEIHRERSKKTLLLGIFWL
jgi:hypothetical protein